MYCLYAAALPAVTAGQLLSVCYYRTDLRFRESLPRFIEESLLHFIKESLFLLIEADREIVVCPEILDLLTGGDQFFAQHIVLRDRRP